MKLGTRRLLWLCLPEPEVLFVRIRVEWKVSFPIWFSGGSTEIWLHTLEHSKNLKMWRWFYCSYTECVAFRYEFSKLMKIKLSDSFHLASMHRSLFSQTLHISSDVTKYFHVFMTMISNCLCSCLNRNNILGRVFLFKFNHTFLIYFFFLNTVLERIAVYEHIALHVTWYVIPYASDTQLGCHVNTACNVKKNVMRE